MEEGPFRSLYIWGTGNGLPEISRCVANQPAWADPASSLERLQCLSQALVLNRKQVAELRSREHCVLGKKIKQLVLGTASVVFVQLGDDLQMGRRVGRDKLQIDWRRSRRRAVFVGQHQAFLGAPEVEVRVAKGMQVTGTSESLTGGDSPAAFFRV